MIYAVLCSPSEIILVIRKYITMHMDIFCCATICSPGPFLQPEIIDLDQHLQS